MKPVSRRLRDRFDRVLAHADVAVVRKSRLDHLEGEKFRVAATQVPLPADAFETLRADNPRLRDLLKRYEGHPAAPAMWSPEFLDDQLDLTTFRGDNAYVWQQRENTEFMHYALTAYYLLQDDPLGLLDQLDEDGLFGAVTHDIDGRLVSRDLLDSVVELTYLHELIDLRQDQVQILDIGAGYGRLADRATAAFPGVHYLCTDAVAQSTFLCEYYLGLRGRDRAQVIPLDEIETELVDTEIDIAVNVHSFSEAPAAAIEWWLDLLAATSVDRFLVIPNTTPRPRGTGADPKPGLFSTEPGDRRIDFEPMIEQRGFGLQSVTPKYRSTAVQGHGVFPGWYYLFERR